MENRTWIIATTISGYICFGISLFSNGILLYIIYLKINIINGAYKHLLAFFSHFSVFFSLVEILHDPLMHVYDNTLFLIQRKKIDFSPYITRFLTSIYCGCYAMSFSILALQFLYRYVVTCKKTFYNYFQGFRCIFWIIALFIIATTCSLVTFFQFPKTERSDLSFSKIVQKYELDPYWTDYVPYGYFNYIKGKKVYKIPCLLGLIQHMIVIICSFSICFFSGIRTYLTITKYSTLSRKTKNLQMQLFRALVLQSIIPLIFVYLPTIFILISPLISDMELSANYQVIIAQLYPAIDPLILLFVIEDFRSTLFKLLLWKKNINSERNVINIEPKRL